MRKNNFIEQVLCLCLLLGVSTHIQAQSNSDFSPTSIQGYYFSPQNQGFSTPQTAEFVQYGNINMNYYNGLLDFEIPFMDYQDPAFELTTSIKYISDGFKPGRRPSVVGNNWILNVGGAITRNVVGGPDDIRALRDMNQGIYTQDGALVAIRDGKFNQYSKTDLFNLNFNLVEYSPPYRETPYDMAPDIFEFNFGRHHGKFIIDNSGNARCISGGGYKIDINQMTVQDFTLNGTPKSSTISIITPDGYLYTFGGDASKLEYSIPNNPSRLQKRPVQITSWYLYSIENVTRQRKVYFNYQSYLQKNKYHLFLSGSESGIMIGSSNIVHFIKKDHFLLEDKLYTPILKNITIDDIKIDFDIKTLPINFWGDSEDSNLLYLSDVTMKKDSEIIKSYHLDYETQGKYFFLKKLTAHNLSENPAIYKFDYQMDRYLPAPLTTSVDHWGFWNGQYESIDNVDTFFNSSFPARKNVNTDVCSCTLLNKVTYPTGGEENILYEYNRYLCYQEKNTNNLGWHTSYQQNATPFGGARVKELSIYNPDNGKKTRRSFSYISPYGTESGVINELPQYNMPEENIVSISAVSIGQTNYKQVTVSSISSNSLGRLNNISEYPIGYAYVTETFYNGSFDLYHYSSFIDAPDDGNLHSNMIKNPTIIRRDFNDYQVMDKALNYTANDFSAFRGKILAKESYDNQRKKVATEKYDYNFDSSKSEYEVSITFNSGCFLANKIFTTPCLMTQEKLTDENGVTITHKYKHNEHGFVTEEETVNSDKKCIYLQYIHPGERSIFPSYIRQDYYDLERANRIEEPVAIIKYVKKADQEKREIVDFMLFDYEQTANAGMQKKALYKSCQKEPLPENINLENIYTWDRLYTAAETYNDYNQYGLFSTHYADGVCTVYLWVYEGKFIAAEIKGSTYAEIKNAFGVGFDFLATDRWPEMEKIELLRKSLPHAHITTYLHKAQTGIKALTKPNNQNSYFQFDAHGRLKQTLRKGEYGELQLMEYNKYHYSNNN